MTSTAPTPVGTRSLRQTFPALTGLRAVASLAVVGTHAAFWTGRYGSDTMGLVWARLDFGVALFFALSGFLLFRPWVASLVAPSGLPDTGRYVWNRLLRIIPAYWIVVVIAFVALDSTVGNGFGGLLRHLTLTQIYGDNHIHAGITQSWSLATELAFYAALPVLGWFIVRVVCRGQWHPIRILVFLGGLCAINFAYFAAIYHFSGLTLTSRMWLPGYLSWFAVGMALTVVVAAANEMRPWASQFLAIAAESPIAFWFAGLGCLALAATPIAGVPSLYQESAGTAIARNILYASAAFLLIAPLVTPRANLVQRTLAVPLMQWLGEISYELFLVHVLLVELTMNVLGYQTFTGSILFVYVVTLAFSIPAAWLLYRVLEVPLKRFHR
ncbi:MAG: putative secreted acyltransferase [Aeromicrobium sp.]|nr:putative secreted acyltransferase [Aeromicrobium sp.]